MELFLLSFYISAGDEFAGQIFVTTAFANCGIFLDRFQPPFNLLKCLENRAGATIKERETAKHCAAGSWRKRGKVLNERESGTVLLDIYNHLDQFGAKCKAVPGLAWQITALWVVSKICIRSSLISFSARRSEGEKLED